IRGADFTQAVVDQCNFTNATVSFADGGYSYGTSPDLVYAAVYPATTLGPLRSSTSVRCPNGALGPCDTRQKLTAQAPTATATVPPTPTPAAGCTPDPFEGIYCPTPTHAEPLRQKNSPQRTPRAQRITPKTHEEGVEASHP